MDADWLKTKLRSILCGSTKEVYETGSQVADLHLMLSTMVCRKTTGTCGTRLKDTVNRACAEGFPDLAREMGLGFLGCDNVEERLSKEGKEDQVPLLSYFLNWFCINSLRDWTRKLAPFSPPIRCKTSTRRTLASRVFPPFRKIACFNFEFSLVGSSTFPRSDWIGHWEYFGFIPHAIKKRCNAVCKGGPLRNAGRTSTSYTEKNSETILAGSGMLHEMTFNTTPK